ncbi:MAG: outer membrane lipoprotein-sorting protein [bacterium]
MKKILIIMILLLSYVLSSAITVDEIIEKMDRNMVFENMKFDAEMTIKEDSDIRTMKMDIYMKDENNVLIEINQSSTGHINRFMKKEGQMWLYIPSAGRSIRIKGHMLKEGFMGSDFSYEDMSENQHSDELYSLDLTYSDTLYVVDMKAKSKEAPYKHVKAYIRKDIFLPVKEEIYSSSGRLLKEFFIEDYTEKQGRYIPTEMRMHDNLKQDSYTKIKYTDVEMNAGISNQYFTKTYFER